MSLSCDEQLALFTRHMGLARRWARRYRRRKLDRRHFDIADLEQAAYLGLWVAAMRFDPGLGGFPHYAARWIKNYLRDETRYRYAVAMKTRAVRAGRPWPIPVDMPELPVDGGQDACVDRLDVAEAVDELKPPEREVTTLYYGIGTDRPLEPREVAVRMGISVTMMNRYRQHARAKLARAFSRSRAG